MGTNSEDQPGVFPGPLGSRCSRRLPCATWCPIPATAQKPRVRKCLQPNYAPWFRPTLANREGGGGAGESESPITSRFPRIRRGLGFTTLGLSAALITFSKDWKAHSGWRRRLARSYSAATVRGGGGLLLPSTMCDGALLPPLVLPLLLLLVWGLDPGTGSAPSPTASSSPVPLAATFPLPSGGILAASACPRGPAPAANR